MAITDVAEYAHLSVADLEALAADLEAIGIDVEDSLGTKDRAYIRRTIAFQRGLEIASRLVIGLGKGKVGWVLGTTALAGLRASRTWNSLTTSATVNGTG
jgi:NADPH-dependent stearoyl-CoA 9-desaturase